MPSLLYFLLINTGAVLPSIKWLGKVDHCLQADQLRNQSALTAGLCTASTRQFFLVESDPDPGDIANPPSGLCLTVGQCATEQKD